MTARELRGFENQLRDQKCPAQCLRQAYQETLCYWRISRMGTKLPFELGVVEVPPLAPLDPHPAMFKTVAFTSPLFVPFMVTLLTNTCRKPTIVTLVPQDAPGHRLDPL